MKKLLLLLLITVSQTETFAQLQTVSINQSEANIKSDKEYIMPDKNKSNLYVMFQKGDNIDTKSTMSFVKVDTTGKILVTKELDPAFPKLNRLLFDTENDTHLYQFYRLNAESVGYSVKAKGIQTVKCYAFDKATLTQSEKTLFTVNYPTEEFLTIAEHDTIHYLLTYEKKVKKINFYVFDSEKLHVKKSYNLPQIEVKKFYEKVFDNTIEVKDFSNSTNVGKIYFENNIFHFVFDYNETQYYMPIDLAKDITYIKEIYLPLKSSVSMSLNATRESSGFYLDNKIFQFRKLSDVLCFGVYDLATQKHIVKYDYKPDYTHFTKSSPFYLDNVAINKKDEKTNQNKFLSELNDKLIAIEVEDKGETYQVKIGGAKAVRFSRANMFDNGHMQFMMRQEMMIQNTMQNAIKFAPPSMRSISTYDNRYLRLKMSLLAEDLNEEAFFYLNLKKSDFAVVENSASAPSKIPSKALMKLMEELVVNGKKISPIFKIGDKKGFGFYNKETKRYDLKIEE